ncbi:N-acetylmuramoyl-L-alanine amidase [Pseudobacteroides cellulosolvens]|uniref:Cell wall hydrolase/autolysin n=1 Tax=Pseudobacteroides cellulosolvens ATCC 35603 = DSM 2933 TaxID=398512 RepID=A0A0L6JIL8_9FIRM|nr:N-acetylmuramoyl-L-alanine amidase [Pseudobacteroides cellulosolvens]KNY25297.1 cell wall hydrolase/autolysin [Pseudobacteroides cellulosolvens ATCC 35603 = DSM 2933]
MKKRVFALIISFIILVAALPAYSYNIKDIQLVVNGQNISLNAQPVLINGRILVPARIAVESMGGYLDWYAKEGRIVAKRDNLKLTMYSGGYKAYCGNSTIKMDVPPVLKNGTVMLPIRFIAENFGYPVKYDAVNGRVIVGNGDSSSGNSRGDDRGGNINFSNYKVVIDAGHGGYETGAIVSGVYEKDLNLAIAKKLNTLLKNSGVKTYMTRTTDRRVGLYERSGLANSVNADLFISIHNNTQWQKSIKGSMTLYYPNGVSKNGLNGYKFASIVQKNLNSKLGTDNKGVIQRPNLAVLRTSKMPAVLVEVGYMTNRTELGKLLTDSYKEKAAVVLKDSVLEALKNINK